ncbi:MAG: hypothetical protein KDC12_03815 [Flavobacteriales bacterium]|nr:hypothetical protein [Flavobacteriales bacterium]
MNQRKFSIAQLMKNGSTLIVLLFSFVLTGWSFLEVPSDTIIIDGKLVVVNRQVEYDTLSTQDEPVKEIKKQYHKWGLNIDIGGGPAWVTDKSALDGFQSLHQFTGKRGVVGSSFRGGGSVSFHWDKKDNRWFVQAGVHINVVNLPNSFFAESTLDTALTGFYLNANKEVEQIVTYVYDIGTENDTLPLKLIKSNLNVMELRFPVSFTYLFPTESRSRSITAEVGLMNGLILSHTGGPFSLISQNGSYQYVADTDLHLRGYRPNPFVSVGITQNLGRNQRTITWNPEFYAHVRFIPGITTLNIGDDIMLNHHDVQLVVGLRFFLKKKLRGKSK